MTPHHEGMTPEDIKEEADRIRQKFSDENNPLQESLTDEEIVVKGMRYKTESGDSSVIEAEERKRLEKMERKKRELQEEQEQKASEKRKEIKAVAEKKQELYDKYGEYPETVRMILEDIIPEFEQVGLEAQAKEYELTAEKIAGGDIEAGRTFAKEIIKMAQGSGSEVSGMQHVLEELGIDERGDVVGPRAVEKTKPADSKKPVEEADMLIDATAPSKAEEVEAATTPAPEPGLSPDAARKMGEALDEVLENVAFTDAPEVRAASAPRSTSIPEGRGVTPKAGMRKQAAERTGKELSEALRRLEEPVDVSEQAARQEALNAIDTELVPLYEQLEKDERGVPLDTVENERLSGEILHREQLRRAIYEGDRARILELTGAGGGRTFEREPIEGQAVVLVGGYAQKEGVYTREIEHLRGLGYDVHFINPDAGIDPTPDEYNAVVNADAMGSAIPDLMVRKAAEVRKYMEDNGLEQAAVVGHSQGGSVAAVLAVMNPSLVKHLVLENPVGLIGEDTMLGVGSRSAGPSSLSDRKRAKAVGRGKETLQRKLDSTKDILSPKNQPLRTQEARAIAATDITELLKDLKENPNIKVSLLTAKSDKLFSDERVAATLGLDAETLERMHTLDDEITEVQQSIEILQGRGEYDRAEELRNGRLAELLAEQQELGAGPHELVDAWSQYVSKEATHDAPMIEMESALERILNPEVLQPFAGLEHMSEAGAVAAALDGREPWADTMQREFANLLGMTEFIDDAFRKTYSWYKAKQAQGTTGKIASWLIFGFIILPFMGARKLAKGFDKMTVASIYRFSKWFKTPVPKSVERLIESGNKAPDWLNPAGVGKKSEKKGKKSKT